jgi:hypothetical protein
LDAKEAGRETCGFILFFWRDRHPSNEFAVGGARIFGTVCGRPGGDCRVGGSR